MTLYETNRHPCDGDMHSASTSVAEAMVYAIDSINKRGDLLPKVSLGYDIRPTCNSESLILGSMLSLIKQTDKSEYEKSCRFEEADHNPRNVIAVVGPGRSTDSIIASTVGRLFTVPVISPSSTINRLSDFERFSFFFRTAPADKFQTRLIIDLLEHYNWKYIGLFYELNSYGVLGARELSALTEHAGICIAVNMAVVSESESAMSEISRNLVEHDKIRVIVIFAKTEIVHTVLQAIRDEGIDRRFVFIASDGVQLDSSNAILENYYDLLSESIFIEFQNYISDEFKTHYEGLSKKQEGATLWYRKKLKEITEGNNCTNLSLGSIPQPYPATEPAIDAVYAVAFALNATLQQPDSSLDIDGNTFRQNLLNVSFSMNVNKSFEFDRNGDVPGRYQLIMWQRENSTFNKILVGTWGATSESRLTMKEIKWTQRDASVPVSLCVEECMPGCIEVPLKEKCCMGCQRCNDYAIVVNTNNVTECQDCPVTHWPDANFTECLPIKPSFLEYRDAVFVLSIGGSAFGIILSILAAYGLFVHAEHPLIKASCPSLCYINLVGLTFLCVSVCITLLQPTNITCIVLEICISTSFCVSFTPVLLKVNRIWRIFSLELGEELHFASTKDQIIISSIGITVLVSIF